MPLPQNDSNCKTNRFGNGWSVGLRFLVQAGSNIKLLFFLSRCRRVSDLSSLARSPVVIAIIYNSFKCSGATFSRRYISSRVSARYSSFGVVSTSAISASGFSDK